MFGPDFLAREMMMKTSFVGLKAADLLDPHHKGPTGGTKMAKAKRKAQRIARRKGRGK